MTLRAADAWIGKTLFVPPIIWLCQRTGQSQFAISKLFWFIAALDAFYRAETLVQSVIWGLLSIVMMLTASLRADTPSRSLFGWRLLAIGFLLFDILIGVVSGRWAGVEFWIFVLTAEYAATIRTIPPTEIKRRKEAAASVEG